jgi:hypothetical protein
VLATLRHALRHLLPAPYALSPHKAPAKRRFGWYPTNIRMALLSMQVIAEPKIGHTIEKHFVLHDEEEEEGSGDPNDPHAHLHGQARKLQRGIPLDRLTTYLRMRQKR